MHPLACTQRIAWGSLLAIVLLGSCVAAQEENGAATRSATTPAAPFDKPAPLPTVTRTNLPAIFLAGDSTAARGSSDAIVGWGVPFEKYVNRAAADYFNDARGGRSSRTYITEGLWDQLLTSVRAGDYILIQFGQNDYTAVDKSPFRGSVRGIGEETVVVIKPGASQPEIVHTFGWYMRKMIDGAKAKGAIPILLSPTVRNSWANGKVDRGVGQYTEWTRQLAIDSHVAYVDLNSIAADQYEKLGREVVAKYFIGRTHTNAAGADLNARFAISGLKALHLQGVDPLLAADALSIEPAPESDVLNNK